MVSCTSFPVIQWRYLHSDGSALTVLLQYDDCVGLQIFKQNKWISVEPIPDALVINIGDTLEVLANGECKTVEHRTVIYRNKERLSMVTFHAPSYDVELGPLPQLIDEDHPKLFKNYKHADYNRHYLTNKLNGKKSLEFARIQSRRPTEAKDELSFFIVTAFVNIYVGFSSVFIFSSLDSPTYNID
ncbi:codeine O-demethylase-like [Cryptomeria japonica]|uniref:codeine O-demethylase-like n=1 Tax=Cryptomeria japonica TaxID=3369 RepID=UPI0027DA2FE6|nr:codeine O-demethylase-like [Cryptomeria japonica]